MADNGNLMVRINEIQLRIDLMEVLTPHLEPLKQATQAYDTISASLEQKYLEQILALPKTNPSSAHYDLESRMMMVASPEDKAALRTHRRAHDAAVTTINTALNDFVANRYGPDVADHQTEDGIYHTPKIEAGTPDAVAGQCLNIRKNDARIVSSVVRDMMNYVNGFTPTISPNDSQSINHGMPSECLTPSIINKTEALMR